MPQTPLESRVRVHFVSLGCPKNQLDTELSPHGYNVGFNAGAAAGQTVMHLHVHVIPRFSGDMDDPRGGVRHVIPHKGNYVSRQQGLTTGGDDRFFSQLDPLIRREYRQGWTL